MHAKSGRHVRAQPLPEMARSLERHFPSRGMNREEIPLYLLALFLPLALLGYGVWRTYLGLVQFGPAALQAWGEPWFTLAAWGMIPLVFLTVRAVWRSRRAVTVRRAGLVFDGMGLAPLAWDSLSGLSVEDVRYHLFGWTLTVRPRLDIFLRAGKKISLGPHFEHLPELAALIKKHLYPRLLPELRAELHAGRWISFGAARLHCTHLEIGRRRFAWEDVQAVFVEAGLLWVQLAGQKPVSVPAAHLQNVELFLQIIADLDNLC